MKYKKYFKLYAVIIILSMILALIMGLNPLEKKVGVNYLVRVLSMFILLNISINIFIYNIFEKLLNIRPHRKNKPSFKFLIGSISNNLNEYIDGVDEVIKEKESISEKLQRVTKINQTILEISSKVIEFDKSEDMLNYILEKSIDIIDNAHKGSFLAINNSYFSPMASVGYNHKILKKIRLSLDETFFKGREKEYINLPVVIDNISKFNSEHLDDKRYKILKDADGLDIKTTLSCPVFINDEMYGILNIDSQIENAFTAEDSLIIKHFVTQIEGVMTNYEITKEKLYLSRCDGLTGLYNRHYFEELLDKNYKISLENKEDFILAVFDLDEFKRINDIYGHAFGDKAIKLFARELKNSFRKSDLIARYGGDEFIGVFFNSDKEFIINRINKLKERFNKTPMLTESKDNIKIKFSYGMSRFPEDSQDMKALFKIADKRMYENKEKK